MAKSKRQKRFEILEQRPVALDGFLKEIPESGLIAMDSPFDPKPSVEVANGKIVEMDGVKREKFDMIDRFIADHTIDVSLASEMMAIDCSKLAYMLVDPAVSRSELIKIFGALTPAKIAKVLSLLNVVELMMAMYKMRARKHPAEQCHVTNVRDNPVLIAADAAEGALYGFDELETTVANTRYGPLNAISLLVGGHIGRPGVLTCCSMEESVELRQAMSGWTSYAETISTYGTERVFVDGDDTPWSKGFLCSAYQSRGAKTRFTSGGAAELLMGYPDGKSMLYLEVRTLMVTKGDGAQGTQNGCKSCIGVGAALPGGIRAILAENLAAAILDLETVTGNDQSFTHSDIRRVARTLMQLLPGTDFICGGYSATPNYDNMFAGSNWDTADYYDWMVLQRDLKVDGGLRPIKEEQAIEIRSRAARAIQCVFEELGLPSITDDEIEAAIYCNGSREMPERDMVADMKAAQRLVEDGISGIDIAKILAKNGYTDAARGIFEVLKQRIAGDYLQTSAIIDKNFHVISSVNEPNDYSGPGTGYRVSDEKWKEIQKIPMELGPEDLV